MLCCTRITAYPESQDTYIITGDFSVDDLDCDEDDYSNATPDSSCSCSHASSPPPIVNFSGGDEPFCEDEPQDGKYMYRHFLEFAMTYLHLYMRIHIIH